MIDEVHYRQACQRQAEGGEDHPEGPGADQRFTCVCVVAGLMPVVRVCQRILGPSWIISSKVVLRTKRRLRQLLAIGQSTTRSCDHQSP